MRKLAWLALARYSEGGPYYGCIWSGNCVLATWDVYGWCKPRELSVRQVFTICLTAPGETLEWQK